MEIPSKSMQVFESKVGTSLGLFFIQSIFLLGLLYLIFTLTTSFRLTQISTIAWFGIVITYLSLSYLYAGFTNNSFLLFESRLEVVNHLPLFKKHYAFQLDKIKSVKFKHEWTETFGKNIKPSWLRYLVSDIFAPLFFPSDYKWVNISAEKDFKFYCFGIEMDYYENEDPSFEDLFVKLAEKGIDVSWTDISAVYYSQLTAISRSKKQNKTSNH